MQMADLKTDKTQEGSQALRRGEKPGLQRRTAAVSPFDLMERMSEELDRTFNRLFQDFGVARRPLSSRGVLGWSPEREALWSPKIEAFQKGDKFIVRAELPGLKKDDVQVDLTDDELTIRGERRAEHEEEREGVYHTEREYGRFERSIPLPEGVISESAEASFKDGVLEVTVQAPPEATRRRRVEITDASAEGKGRAS